MNEYFPTQTPKNSHLPFKSVAVALIFGVILGPLGVLYASVPGAVVMLVLGFVVFSFQLMVPILLVWIMSCVWVVAATNRYNRKLLHILSQHS